MNDMSSFLEAAGRDGRGAFEKGRNILSYREYLDVVAAQPALHLRDAAVYLRDMLDHFGRRAVEYPWGAAERLAVFDQAFGAPRDALVGQEEAQQAFYRVVQSFVREGRPNRLIVLHGPNGSSKSTFAACVGRGLERYSLEEQGVLYRFNWVFPTEKASPPTLGFLSGGDGRRVRPGELAHYDEADIDAKIPCEMKDHPLTLLPLPERARFIEEATRGRPLGHPLPDLLARGGVCPTCRMIFDALLASYRGDLAKVLSHVQVERLFLSRAYRRGIVSIGPQMSVDAGERQVTMSRSLGALPKVLQNVSLFEPSGDLVDASGGMVEFSDFLKRPLETFKYLLDTIESGEVQTTRSILRINAVLLATTNEVHLAAFRQHPDGLSFFGRIATIRIPYLLHEPSERRIYAAQVVAGLEKHAAPHAAGTAAAWAVMTRLAKPDAAAHGEELGRIAGRLTCAEKLDLYREGIVPQRLPADDAKTLAGEVARVFHETDNLPVYEGMTGASPREMKLLVSMAAQGRAGECLTAQGVLEELAKMTERVKDFGFLAAEKEEGGYRDFAGFLAILRDRLLDDVLGEAVASSAFFTPDQFAELWGRYVLHASTWIKGEKVHNPVTKKDEAPDETLMERVEKLLGERGGRAYREEVLGRIAAAALTERGQKKPDYARIFGRTIEKLRAELIKEELPRLARLVEEALSLLVDGAPPGGGGAGDAAAFLSRFQQEHGYCPRCARTSLAFLLNERLR